MAYQKIKQVTEHLQEFSKPISNLDFFGKIEKLHSPTTPYLNSQSLCTWKNQSNSVQIYVCISINQSRGGRTRGRLRSKDMVPNTNVREKESKNG